MTRIQSSGALRQREPRVRNAKHMGLVARLPCLGCLTQRGTLVRPVHVCHIRTGFHGEDGWRAVGAGEKPSDFRTWPGCPRCHLVDQHGGSERAFWRALRIYPPAFCAALVKDFSRGGDGMLVLRLAATGKFPWPPEAAD